MNKFNKLLAVALVLFSVNSFAADCSALSGQYTIGKSQTSDYHTVNDALAALKCGGVSAPVTFLLESGTYNEKLVIPNISGTSAFNTVTFASKTGNNADAVISYATSDATLILSGVSYVYFENLTIDHKASTYGNCARIEGKSSNLRFKSVVFDGVEVARTGNNSATVYFAPNNSRSDISFEDCEINNGSTGIYKAGVSPDVRDEKTNITGTLFFNQYESGLALSNEDAPVISNNVISSLTSYNSFKAINLDNVSNSVVISNNIVNAANGAVGLAMHDCVAQPSMLGQINNNSIAVGGKNETYDVYLTGSTDNQVLNFNRLKLSLSNAQASNQAFYKNSATGNNVNMMNNICYDLVNGGYTIIGNSYKDIFNQLPLQSNSALSVSANGIMIEKVTPIK